MDSGRSARSTPIAAPPRDPTVIRPRPAVALVASPQAPSGMKVLGLPAEAGGAIRGPASPARVRSATVSGTKFSARSISISSGCRCSITLVSHSPPWMPWRFSGQIEQLVHVDQPRPHRQVTANMSSFTRSSRQTMSITCGWPPCEIQEQDLAAAGAMDALAEFEYQTRPSVSCDNVRVPGKARCSSDFPIGIIRQHQCHAVGRHQLHRPRDDARVDRRVDPNRQMRARAVRPHRPAGSQPPAPDQDRRSPGSSDPTTNAT